VSLKNLCLRGDEKGLSPRYMYACVYVMYVCMVVCLCVHVCL
jgi:hypothetical protein